MFKRLAVTALLVGLAGTAQAETYRIDPSHSSIGFSVRHLAISKVKGNFNEFSGTIQFDPRDTSLWAAEVVIQTQSVDTRDPGRDNHLRTDDFFNAVEYPTMTFKSTKVKPGKKGTFELIGDLTIRDVTKPVTLKVEILGTVIDPSGVQRVGFSAGTTINRLDYGVKWSKTLEAGGLIVGQDVDITIDIEAEMHIEEQ
ncbi:MAG TPA: YceI family protein [Acidobacteriota bacterium]|nr:YceI family protein [Acidobacteriota bacterium]